MLLADLRQVPDEQLAEQLRRLSAYSGVAMSVLGETNLTQQDLKQAAANMLLSQWQESDTSPTAAWADAIVADASAPADFVATYSGSGRPVFAFRQQRGSVAERRAGCDRLQADLAPPGNFAGYIV